MDFHEREGDSGESRIKRLYDRLAAIFRRLPADRQQAFREHLDEQAKKENDDDGNPEKSDPREH